MFAADFSGRTPLNPQVMFKANNHIYKKHGFSNFDHTLVRKKTHQNELKEWRPDRWALASGSAFIILDLLGNMGESVGPAHWPKADDFACEHNNWLDMGCLKGKPAVHIQSTKAKYKDH